MLFRTFKDLCDSPLGESDGEIEKILLDFVVRFGSAEIKLHDLKRALTLLHEVYHSSSDTGDADSLPPKWLPPKWLHLISKVTPGTLPTISDLPNLSHPSDTVLKNIFKIMFESDAWDYLVFDKRLEEHVFRLKKHASSRIAKKTKRNYYDCRMAELFEIWSEMLEKITEKKREKEDKRSKESTSNGLL